MSSYIVSEKDIALLVESLYRYTVVVPTGQSDALGQLLWQTNHDSVNARYDEGTPCPPYVHRGCVLWHVKDPILVYKQVQHYTYQSCDHDAWEASEPFRLMEALEQKLLAACGHTDTSIRQLPLWGKLPWGLD